MKNAVSTSQPIATPLPTPNLITTQSPSGESLCRLVSQPSYQAPFSVNVFGRLIGGKGLIRFEAEAKNSSENATIFPPSAEETRSYHLVSHPKREYIPTYEEVKTLSKSEIGTCVIWVADLDIRILLRISETYRYSG